MPCEKYNYYQLELSKGKKITNKIKQVCNRDIRFYKVFWNEPEKNNNLNSFIVNSKTTGKRNISILSTMHPIFYNSKHQEKKPALYKLYDFFLYEIFEQIWKKSQALDLALLKKDFKCILFIYFFCLFCNI